MNKIDYVVTSTTKYIEQMTKAQRKKLRTILYK